MTHTNVRRGKKKRLPQSCLARNVKFLRASKHPGVVEALGRLYTFCYGELATLILGQALKEGPCFQARALLEAARVAGVKLKAKPKTIAEVRRQCVSEPPETGASP